MRMTVPLNSWMRSRSPSLILTCTLTLSPAFTGGIFSFGLASRALMISAIRFVPSVYDFSSRPPPTSNTGGVDNYAVGRYATADYSTHFRYSQAGWITEYQVYFLRASMAVCLICLTNRRAN